MGMSSLFSAFKRVAAPAPANPDFVSSASRFPTFVVGDGGSGRSFALQEAARQAVVAGRRVLLFGFDGQGTDTYCGAPSEVGQYAQVWSGAQRLIFTKSRDVGEWAMQLAKRQVATSRKLVATFGGPLEMEQHDRESSHELLVKCVEFAASGCPHERPIVLVDSIGGFSDEHQERLMLAAKYVDLVQTMNVSALAQSEAIWGQGQGRAMIMRTSAPHLVACLARHGVDMPWEKLASQAIGQYFEIDLVTRLVTSGHIRSQV